MEQNARRSAFLKLAFLWLGILFLGSFWLTVRGSSSPATTSSKTYQYAYSNPLKLGEQLNFTVEIQLEQESYEQVVSSPPYPPQVWSSFVSFASFSTSLMGSMSTMTYYQTAFTSDMGFNVGLLCSVALIVLLIFLELSAPLVEGRTVAVLGRLRMRFSTVTWILFVIVMGIVYTTVMMILAT